MAVPAIECRISPHYFLLRRFGFAYSTEMDYAESAKDRLENHWRAKLEEARVRYSETPCTESKASYRSALKAFWDLVLRGEAPEALQWG